MKMQHLAMNTIHFRSLVLALALTAWVTLPDSSPAATEVPLVSFTNVWRYNAWGTNIPTVPGSWTSPYYDDSWWQSGLPLFGYETSSGVYPFPFSTLILPPDVNGPMTVYFRMRFDFPSNTTSGVTLVASNYLDDGAVFYVNGTEVQRIRIPGGNVDYDTPANTSSREGVYDVFPIPATNLLPGENLIAVELHQYYSVSSDTVFGMSLTAIFPTPIVIVTQPQSQTVDEGTRVTFSVGVTGDDPKYSWFTNGVRVFGITTPTYTIANPKVGQSGIGIRAVVTNFLGAVTSEVAVLTVQKDVFPPGLVSAVAQETGASNTILVTFTENLLSAHATNTVNYTMTRLGTIDSVTISNALHFGNTVTLRVGGPSWMWGNNYLLTVTNVCDPKSNYVSSLSNRVMVTFPQELLAFDALSLYWNWIEATFYRDPAISLPLNWAQPDLDDTDQELWRAGPGALYYDWYPQASACEPLSTPLSTVSLEMTTHYFRTHFNAPANTSAAACRLDYLVADGAVFYLNGAEIFRHNMPAGVVGPSTPALAPSLVCNSTTNFPINRLQSGDNVLAVEVHRASQSMQVYLGLRIRATIPVPLP